MSLFFESSLCDVSTLQVASLTQRRIMVAGETLLKPLSEDEALDNRNALCKVTNRSRIVHG